MKITLNSPLDMHLHLRDGDMLKLTAPLSADFAGAVIMPNLVPPVTDPGAMMAYSERIAQAMGDAPFSRYMTLFFTRQTEQQLVLAKETPGFFGFKLYPAGITTNSEGGVSDMGQADTTLRLMEELGIPSAFLVGVSMGGMIAQHFAADYPAKVKKLRFVPCLTLYLKKYAIPE